jgi:dihydroorotase
MSTRIDPHVHCRDGSQTYKTTIKEVLEVAQSQGVDIVFDMPNTEPPIISVTDIQERLSLVPQSEQNRYFLYVGLTADTQQIIHAVSCWHSFPKVIGLKMFAGRSVGSLAVVNDDAQKNVYRILAERAYKGVVAVHCERELDLKVDLWDSARPASHSDARPKIAETHSVENQIKFAREAGFNGTLHICHVSCPESVAIIKSANADFSNEFKITCGVTPHHLLFSTVDQKNFGLFGNMLKVNPPLRSEKDRKALLECLLNGEIDWIETDHATHTLAENLSTSALSGIPSLFFYKHLVEEYLPNMGASEDFIEYITFRNIVDAFSPKLDRLVS